MASAAKALVAALAATLPGSVGGQTYVGPEYIPAAQHPVPMWLSPPKQANIASCAIDVGISLVFLGQAGSAINAAVDRCNYTAYFEHHEGKIPDSEKETQKAACSASVSGVVAGFAYAAGFLQQAAADCQNSFQVVNPGLVAKAACGADITNFIASLALLAESGSMVRDTCSENKRSWKNRFEGLGFPTNQPERRLAEEGNTSHFTKLTSEWRSSNMTAHEALKRELQKVFRLSGMQGGKKKGKNGKKNGKKIKNYSVHAPGQPNELLLRDRSAEMTECVFDVGQATFFLARAALMINAAVADCSHFEMRTGGKPSHLRCGVDIASVISAFSFVASGISFASNKCAFWTTLAPACAGSIANMVAALSQIAASGASFQGTCGFVGRRLSEEAEQHKDVLV